MSKRRSSAHTLPLVAAATLLIVGCDVRRADTAAGAQESFWLHLGELCGRAYEGRIAANTGAGEGPDPFENKVLTMHVRECSDDTVRVPLHVGEDRSRTWVFTRTPQGLRLKHDHRHEDGSADTVTMYGGDTMESGSASEQRFPADEESKALFEREGLGVSVQNTWVVGIEPAHQFSYALVRPGRVFRIEFDLTQPVTPPPSPWGARQDAK